MRRRYSLKCNDVNQFTLPCTGTYACLCRHGDNKEYFRVSKTLPIVPSNYKGLTIVSLDAVWTEEVEETNDDDDDNMTVTLIIGIVSGIVGSVILCCICYYAFICYAK